MSKSKLLKEAIADANAVRETAIQNAKIALEEAFTPRLQSILSRKLQAEMEEFEDEDDVEGEVSMDDSEFGSDEEEMEMEESEDEFGSEESEDEFGSDESEEEFDMEESEDEFGSEEDEFGSEEDEDEMDLESIIRELEAEVNDELMDESDEDEDEDGVIDDPTGAQIEEEDEMEMDSEEDEDSVEFDDEIDLDEILREMGYGDDEDAETAEEDNSEMEAELDEAYKTIITLRKTINEVNLLNAKLLFTNKLFRNYDLTNEQKVKVVENLDRTSSVREVKLVYATLAESMKFNGSLVKKSVVRKSISEGFASKKVASTAPKKEIITENGDALSARFQKLAGIIKN